MGKWLVPLVLVMAGCVTQDVVVAPGEAHSPELRKYVGISSLAVSQKTGRLWVTWYGGVTPGEDSNNYCVLMTSGDDGRTWKEVLIYDPDGEGPYRAFDPEVWISPEGKLLWTATKRKAPLSSQASNHYAGALADPKYDELMVIELDADNEPEAPYPVPRCVARGVMMCKPIVDSRGRWLFPVAQWQEAGSSSVYASEDGGKTFARIGGATLPKHVREFDEHNLVELKDGSFREYIRAAAGNGHCCWMADSRDGCYNWSETKPANFKNTSARCFVRRLKSGNLILVKNGELDFGGDRVRLTAYLSDDDGATWKGGLRLAEKTGTYPDGDQGADGSIYLTWDNDRLGRFDIHFAKITEADILAGKVVTAGSRIDGLVYGK